MPVFCVRQAWTASNRPFGRTLAAAAKAQAKRQDAGVLRAASLDGEQPAFRTHLGCGREGPSDWMPTGVRPSGRQDAGVLRAASLDGEQPAFRTHLGCGREGPSKTAGCRCFA
jgi:hypothetical protein